MKIVCGVFLLLFGSMNLWSKEEKMIQKDWVLKIIKSESKSIRSCYEEGLKTNPDLVGKILVDFEIEVNGSVQVVKVESSTINNQIVENCLIEKIKTFTFPPPPEKTVVQVKFPFIFTKVPKQ
jgi:hypothetical protein